MNSTQSTLIDIQQQTGFDRLIGKMFKGNESKDTEFIPYRNITVFV